MTTRKSWVLVSNFQSVQYGGAGLGRGWGCKEEGSEDQDIVRNNSCKRCRSLIRAPCIGVKGKQAG